MSGRASKGSKGSKGSLKGTVPGGLSLGVSSAKGSSKAYNSSRSNRSARSNRSKGSNRSKKSTSDASTLNPDDPPQLSKSEMRREVAKELLSTEIKYVESLGILISVFGHPLRDGDKKVPKIDKADHLALFSNVELIHSFHQTLQKEYAPKVAILERGESTTVGDTFLKIAPFLKLYTQYSNNYDNALNTFSKLMGGRRFASWIKEKKADPRTKGLDFSSYLIMPIQRIPRYILLLREMRKFTEPAHADYELLKRAMDALTGVAGTLEKSLKASANLNRIVEIASSLTGDGRPSLVEPHRRFIREGEVTKLTSRFTKEAYLFLFNDMLVYANPQLLGRTYKFKAAITLGTTWVKDLPDVDNIENAFQVVAETKTYTFVAPDAPAKLGWISDLNKQIDALVKAKPELVERRASVHVKQRSGFWKIATTGTPDAYAEKPLQRGVLTSMPTPETAAVDPSSGLPAVPLGALSSPTKEGWMVKQGHAVKNWKKRWFVLKDAFLYYYRAKTDKGPAGVIPLAGATVEAMDPAKGKAEVRVMTSGPDGKEYLMYSDSGSSDKAASWIPVLNKAIPDASSKGLLGPDGLPAAVLLLTSLPDKAPGIVLAAANALATFAEAAGDGGRAEAYDAGAIPPLMRVLENADDNDLAAVAAAAALKALAGGDAGKNKAKKAMQSTEVVGALTDAMMNTDNLQLVEEVAWALTRLTVSSVPTRPKGYAGEAALVPIVGLLSSSDQGVTLAAASALGGYANDAWLRAHVRAAGGLPPLIALLKSRNDAIKEQAAIALGLLSLNDKNRRAIPDAGGVKPLVKCLSSDTESVQEQAAFALRNLADSSNESNLVAIADAGGVSALVHLLGSKNQNCVEQAVTALRYLSQGSKTKFKIRESGGLPGLVELLGSTNETILEQSARAVANIILKDAEIVEEVGGLSIVLALLSAPVLTVQAQAAAGVEMLTKHDKDNMYKDKMRKDGGLKVLIQKLYTDGDTKEVCALLESSTRALLNLSLLPKNKDAIRDANGIRPLLTMVQRPEIEIKSPAVRTLQSLFSVTKNQDMIRRNNGIHLLSTVLKCNVAHVQRHTIPMLIGFAEEPKLHPQLRAAHVMANIRHMLRNKEASVHEPAVKLAFKMSSTIPGGAAAANDVALLPDLELGLKSMKHGVQEMAVLTVRAMVSHIPDLAGHANLPHSVPLIKTLLALAKMDRKAVRDPAIVCLSGLAVDSWCRIPLREAKVITLLVSVVGDAAGKATMGSKSDMETTPVARAAEGLGFLALEVSNRATLMKEGAVEPLIALIKAYDKVDDELVVAATVALGTFGELIAFNKHMTDLGAVAALRQIADHGPTGARAAAERGFKGLSNPNSLPSGAGTLVGSVIGAYHSGAVLIGAGGAGKGPGGGSSKGRGGSARRGSSRKAGRASTGSRKGSKGSKRGSTKK